MTGIYWIPRNWSTKVLVNMQLTPVPGNPHHQHQQDKGVLSAVHSIPCWTYLTLSKRRFRILSQSTRVCGGKPLGAPADGNRHQLVMAEGLKGSTAIQCYTRLEFRKHTMQQPATRIGWDPNGGMVLCLDWTMATQEMTRWPRCTWSKSFSLLAKLIG